MNRISTTFVRFLFCAVLISGACRNKESSSKTETDSQIIKSEKDYLATIIALDTLSAEVFKSVIEREISHFKVYNRPTDSYFHFFTARKYLLEKKQDSALAVFQKMKGEAPDDDLELLKTHGVLSLSFGDGLMVESKLMGRILAAMETAEKVHSRITYRFYDLLAKAYFQNGNVEKSLKYTALYYENHPYKTHAVVKQRYYDISFLLASRLGDYQKMKFYNGKARELAVKIGDSLAIARTYNNESQIYAQQNQNAKALEYSKIYFNYLKENNQLYDIAYNNLATSFIRNKQPDSAIKYYLEGIELEKKNKFNRQKELHYNGLKDAYILKGDFVRALEAADSSYTIGFRNHNEIEAVKIAEIQEKYETEKKDRSIVELNERNKLNETLITQQRWTLVLFTLIFLGGLFFFYFLYRQQRLKGKNTLLKSENQRLKIEQKLLQTQLNPHFIFNAIANLQSLIASGHVDESVSYLNSFSGLLRGILEQNRKDFIELGEELNSLNDYIRLQQMRYDGVFNYKIIVDENLSLEHTLIPPMLIQPFVENAIEHGFRHINYKGDLEISFNKENEMLVIRVDDNGSGINNNEVNKQKKQSLAQVILKERLALLFVSSGQTAKFTVNDKKQGGGQGVIAEIIIPLIEE
ncbi:MAG: histidine kinase [Pedobacter sp.]|uniref:tetratricopeptide repeat-containing sensor histidine kinase n=1 Tax=Pedobacter sp. TaxID=1411316 RepID=UPI003563922D